MFLYSIEAVVAIILLYVGAEIAVRFSSKFARHMGMRPFLVGLTIVAFTTSLPEALSCILAQAKGGSDGITLGTIIGSNIANVGLILGIILLVHPFYPEKELRRKEVLIFLAATFLFSIMVFHHSIGRIKGGILLAFFVVALVAQIFIKKKVILEEKIKKESDLRLLLIELSLIIVGVVSVLIGAYLIVHAAKQIAIEAKVSQRIVGISLVAIGTSCPELVISFVAAVRKKTEIALGNILGSNLFNCLFVGGISALIRPLVISEEFIQVDIPIMIFLSIMLALFCWVQTKLFRLVGLFFLSVYVFYLVTFVF